MENKLTSSSLIVTEKDFSFSETKVATDPLYAPFTTRTDFPTSYKAQSAPVNVNPRSNWARSRT